MPCTREVVNLNNVKDTIYFTLCYDRKLWLEKNEIHVKTQNKVPEYFIYLFIYF